MRRSGAAAMKRKAGLEAPSLKRPHRPTAAEEAAVLRQLARLQSKIKTAKDAAALVYERVFAVPDQIALTEYLIANTELEARERKKNLETLRERAPALSGRQPRFSPP